MTPPYRPSDPMQSQHIAPQQPLQWPVKRWELPRGESVIAVKIHCFHGASLENCHWNFHMSGIEMGNSDGWKVIICHHTGPIFGMFHGQFLRRGSCWFHDCVAALSPKSATNTVLTVNNCYWLVVWTPLTNMKVSWDDDIPNIWKNKTCSKPPTSVNMISNEVETIIFFSGTLPVLCLPRPFRRQGGKAHRKFRRCKSWWSDPGTRKAWCCARLLETGSTWVHLRLQGPPAPRPPTPTHRINLQSMKRTSHNAWCWMDSPINLVGVILGWFRWFPCNDKPLLEASIPLHMIF